MKTCNNCDLLDLLYKTKATTMKHTLTTILITLSLCFSIGAIALPLPPGSYQETCKLCKMNGGTLSCTCKNPNHKFAGKSYLAFSLACKKIENVNGLLSCKGGYDYPAMPGQNPQPKKQTNKNAGSIYSNQQAKKVCPKICGGKKHWHGKWHTTGSTSYCQCKKN